MFLFTVCLITLSYFQSAYGGCTFSNNGSTFHILESDPAGTTVIKGTKGAGDNVTFDLRSGLTLALGNELQNSFKLTVSTTDFIITNTKVIDLEGLKKNFNLTMNLITVQISCGNQSESPVIAVDAVDEYPPTFTDKIYRINVPENTNIGSTVFHISKYVSDEDVTTGQQFSYSIQETGASTPYFLCNPGSGDITLLKALEYDGHNPIRRFNIILKVEETDGNFFDGSSMLVVTVTNVEDVPPYFVYPNCPPPCMAPLYAAITTLTYKGTITLNPRNFKSGDTEGFGTNRLYFISQGNNYNIFTVDQTSGVLSQTKSVNEVNALESEFRLIVKVQKENHPDLSAIAVVVIRVKERLKNATTFGSCSITPVTAQVVAPEESGSNFFIPMIVMGAIAAVTSAALILMFIFFKRKQNDAVVSPILLKPGMPNGGLRSHGIGGAEYNNRAVINALPVFDKKQPLSTLK
ncbi:Protocadherin [Mactra antiquata]